MKAPALAPGVGADKAALEAHQRARTGLSAEWVEDPRVLEHARAFRRRGGVLAVVHEDVPRRDRWRDCDRTVPSVVICLQLPRSVRWHMRLPHLRTDAGDHGMFSPSVQTWRETHGGDGGWERFVAHAPGEPWDEARRYTMVCLEAPDPAEWLEQLVERVDREVGRTSQAAFAF